MQHPKSMCDYTALLGSLREDLACYQISGPRHLTDARMEDHFAQALIDSFFKKLCPSGTSPSADANALEKFRVTNDSLPVGTFRFDAADESESCFADYFKNNLRRALEDNLAPQTTYNPFTQLYDEYTGNFDLDFIRETLDVGPGASQLADSTTLVTKLFCGPLSTYGSKWLLSLYRAAIADTESWAIAEKQRFSDFGVTEVRGGKLFFVKKNADISRTCCTEALLDMLFQKSCGSFLEARLLKHFGINLSVQPDFNRELTRLGSIDGSFGTMDLSSASDSVSLALCEWCLPDGLLKNVMFASSARNAILPDGTELELRMISTMGNGFTFPLETIIFASAVRAVYQLMDLPSSDPSKHFGVFGDDIIVRREAYDYLAKMLTKLGFRVNDSKSFNTGIFRESCGEDYISGVNIRGVYVTSLETHPQVCSLINRLNRWVSRSKIRLPSTLSYLYGLVPRAPSVPYFESDDAGIKRPFYLTRPKVDDRYWFRYRCLRKAVRKVPAPEPDDTANPHGFAIGYLSGHTTRPFVLNRIEGFLPSCPNPEAWWSIRDLDDANARYKVVNQAVPYWDWPGPPTSREARQHEAWRAYMLAL